MDTNNSNMIQNEEQKPVETPAAEQQTVETPAAEQPAQQPLGPDAVQLLTEIRDMTRKDLILRRISSGAILCVCVAILLVVLNVVPKVVTVIENVNNIATSASESLRDIDEMVADMSEASANINKLVNDNAEPLSQAVTNMSNVDFEGLNKAIADLQTTVGPMASFFGRFK